MQIKFSEIVYLLSQKHRVREILDAYFDAPLKSVRRYRGAAEAGYIYCIPISRFRELHSHPIEKLQNCAFVVYSGGSEEENLQWEQVIQSRRFSPDLIYVNDVAETENLIEEIADYITKLLMWESDLRDLLNLGRVELDELLSRGRRVLGCQMAIFDRNFTLLGATDEYFSKDSNIQINKDNQQLSQEMIKMLLKDSDYQNAELEQGLFHYPSQESESNLLCYNINHAGEYSARVMMQLPSFQVSQGLEALYQVFVEYVEKVYLHNLNYFPAARQDDTLHRLFKKYLFHSRKRDYESDFRELSMYNWYRYDTYRIIVLQIFGAREYEQGASYLCMQLEQLYPYSCTYRTDREIIWIINITRDKAFQDNSSFGVQFPLMIRDFGCKAGISDDFKDYTALSNYRRQADIALEMGEKKDPYKWYFHFSDYTLEYMLSQMTSLFSADQLMHKGLKALAAYDKEHDTEFVPTLKCYLESGFNASEAAQKLFIHRTTFIRRMERIESLISLDLQDRDQLLHILLSLRMSERGEKDERV